MEEGLRGNEKQPTYSITSGTCKSYLQYCVQTDAIKNRVPVLGLSLTPQMWQEAIADVVVSLRR
jgi:hypothetical protein